MYDNVSKPRHYQFEKECSEVRDVITDRIKQMLSAGYSTDLIYDYSNAIKYLLRWPLKNGEEDLNKALYCIQNILSSMPKEEKQTVSKERIPVCYIKRDTLP